MKKTTPTKKRILAWLLLLGILFGFLPGNHSSVLQAEVIGDRDTFKLESVNASYSISFPNGAMFNSSAYVIRSQSSNKAVFCMEPVIILSQTEEYTAYSPLTVTLNGYTTRLGFSSGRDRNLTSQQLSEIARWVYHGWTKSTTKTANEYLAIQLHIWELVWDVSVNSFTNLSQLRTIQNSIRAKVRDHGNPPQLSGSGYNAATNTVTMKPGDSVTLTASEADIASAAVAYNTTGVTITKAGSAITFTAPQNGDISSGTIVFVKYSDVENDATSLLYSTGGDDQKVGMFRLSDPGTFEIQLQAVNNGGIHFTKTTEGSPLDGAVFELRNSENEVLTLKQDSPGTYTADASGTVTQFTTSGGETSILDLPEGSYMIREISAAEGFVLNTSPIEVSVAAGAVSEATMDNRAQLGALSIQKNNSASEALAGAVFTITGPEGFSEEVTTGSDGTAKLTGLTLGTYTITETKAPDGYLLSSPASRTVSLTWDSSVQSVSETAVFTNEKQLGELVIRKNNSAGTGLAGAVFTVSGPNGYSEEVTSGSDGTVILTGLELGIYTVTEIRPPAAYTLAEPSVQKVALEWNTSEEVVRNSATFVNEEQSFRVTLRKTDAATGNALAGAEFVLKDPEGKVLEEMRTGADGTIQSSEHSLLFDGGIYSIEETKAPAGYLLDSNPIRTIEIQGDQANQALSFSLAFENEAITAPVTIQKYDVLGGSTPSGDASLAGAVYDLVVVDLFNPANAPYAIGDIADTLTTDVNGSAKSKNLHLGSYDLVEKQASDGYLANDTAVRFSITSDGVTTTVSQDSTNAAPLLAEINSRREELNRLWETEGGIHQALQPATEAILENAQVIQTAERVLYGRIEINKVLGSSLDVPGEPKTPEAGVQFALTDSNGNQVDVLETNTDGWAASTWLPFGRYTLTQVTDQENAYAINPIEITIDQDWNMYMYQLENEEVSARLRLLKIDADTGKQIPQAGITFEIYQEDGSQLVQHLYYPQKQEIKQFETAADGSVMLPEVIAAGNYTLKEIIGPKGYVLSADGKLIDFTVSKEQVNRSQDLTLTIEVKNQPAYGQITIDKQGPKLIDWASETVTYRKFVEKEEILETSTHESDASDILTQDGPETSTESVKEFVWEDQSLDVFTPVFDNGHLAEAVFEIRAAEAITLADGTPMYEAGDLVETITTDGKGLVKTGLLPLGNYSVTEIQAPEGYVQIRESFLIELTQENPTQALVQQSLRMENYRQEAEVVFTKTLEASEWFGHYEEATEDIRFGLFTTEDLVIDGVLLPAGSCIGFTGLDGQNKGTFQNVLPGDSYVLRELAASQEYELNEENIPISFVPDVSAGELSTIKMGAAIENELRHLELVLAKVDASNNNLKLEGASFKLVAVTDQGEVEIGEYTTDSSGRIGIQNLQVGTYYLQEVQPPKGYYLNLNKIPVILDGSSTVVYQETANKTTRAVINKVHELTAETVAGATLQIIDLNGVLVHEWVSDGQAKDLEGVLLAGKEYILRELLAPAGYETAADIRFTVPLSEPEVQTIQTMINKPTTTEISKASVGGTELPGAKLTLYDQEGTIVDSWISTDLPHVIRGLVKGQEYTLHEDAAPAGYNLAQRLTFKLKEDGSVTPVVMVDELTTTEVSKQTVGGEELPGAELTIVDEAGNVMEKWTSTDTPHIVRGLERGKTYLLRENAAPAGYDLAQEISFTIREDGSVTSVVMTNELTTTEVSKQTAGGEELPGAELTILDENGNVIEEWTSTETPHIIRGLERGKTYILRENAAPAGYDLTQEIPFEIKKDGAVTKVLMINHLTPTVPKTGESQVPIWSFIGLLLVLTVGTRVSIKKKKED